MSMLCVCVCVCVCVALVTQNVMRMRYIVPYNPSSSKIFFHIISQARNFDQLRGLVVRVSDYCS
jgi:hypothetical protein